MKLFQKIATPCIGVCSTGIGDSVCRGCKRFDYEVIQWNGFDETQKQAIDERLDRLLSGVVARYLELFDSAQLAQQLKLQQLRYAAYRDPYCWLFELLRAGASQIDKPSQYGFTIRPGYQHINLVDVRDMIDHEYYLLSVAHYERYIVANRRRARHASGMGETR
ncbi:MAG: DUF1289 domain-containing protein [Gammaproteobacteria bacterium]|nr:DUF1289 domain-containing protein [Gammaproteobacteria bacterium]MBT8150871.1 DUF1289 domain-containing protein [Gammaproteobacteria bacterium]NND38031.1 DUF1289 domain-containing protein [Pseudomonadales bacterium]NNM10628.1 DUF1289 domain-containing protein [Pseudomonadales bacterium]RZV60019.1 MAG: DUF1289 domain-containing protein [Pseudomonadales bacterium]